MTILEGKTDQQDFEEVPWTKIIIAAVAISLIITILISIVMKTRAYRKSRRT